MYMEHRVLLQEFLHPPQASRDCGETEQPMNELTLAGSRFVFILLLGILCRISKVSLKSSSLKAHIATQGKATYHATSCKRLHIISSGSRESNGHRPHLGNATPLASSSIHGEHRNDLYSNSKKHQGDLSWMPSVTVALLAPGRVLRRSFGLVPLAREMALIRMRLPLARSWSLLQPLLVFLLPPPQPAFCVRPEGWLLQLRFASPSFQYFQAPREGCVHTIPPGIFASRQKGLG